MTRIVFIHPDLGIGGAERLVIDAAVGLQSQGHQITILTSYCDKKHCFEEARDGTLDVRVRGDAIFPTSLAGRFSILFTILRQLALVFSAGILTPELRRLHPDIFFVDQLSTCVPLLRCLFPRAKVLFYGHFPDRLLVVEDQRGLRRHLKRLYRIPFDALEGWSTDCSDSVVVNSKFTRTTFRKTFPSLRSRDLRVIYPCVDTSPSSPPPSPPLFPSHRLLLSINRFEHKKNLPLALRAFSSLSPAERDLARLVIAGGHDPRNAENASCLDSLRSLADSLSLPHATFAGPTDIPSPLPAHPAQVLFLLSIPSSLKSQLLRSASILLYTPENEHFGIVPLEAMLAGVPVLATDTGGPLETIYDGRTGWLRGAGRVERWTEVMRKALIPSSEEGLRQMGVRGRERVVAEFGRGKMVGELDAEIRRLMGSRGKRSEVLTRGFWVVVAGAVVAAIVAVLVGMIGVGFVAGRGR